MDYDLVVIGTGTAGSSAASICSSGGLKVAIVDYRPFGGTCALRGCTPKKVLVGATSMVDHIKKMRERGVLASDVAFSWKELMRFKRSFTDPVPRNREQYYEDNGIDAYKGSARFVGDGKLDAGGKVLGSEKYLIASGSTPRRLGIKGEEYIITSEAFMELDELPSSIIFVGGGYISFEFAHVAALAGADVTILHRGPRPLSNFNLKITKRLLEVSERMGIKVVLDSTVMSVQSMNGYIVNTKRKGKSGTYRAQCVVHGAGRAPNIDRLELDSIGVQHSQQGIRANAYMQSVSNPNVYVAGDVVEGTPPLKTVSEKEGMIAGSNILNGNNMKMDYSVVPSVLFTVPEIASVGITERDAANRGMEYEVVETDMSNWFSSSYIDMHDAYSKIIKDKASGIVLGAHLMCPRAGELANLFALAIKMKVPSEDLKFIPWAFPTNTSDIAYIV